MKAHPHGSPPRKGTVTVAEMAARTLKKIRLEGPDLVGLECHPGQQVLVSVGGSSEDLTLRTYSIWDYDADAGVLDLIVMLHGNGPGSAWAEALGVGDEAVIFGPKGSFVLNPRAQWHLFVGDETGSVALQAMLRAVPEEHPVMAVFEGDRPEDALPPLGEADPTEWVFREGGEPGMGSAMCQRLAELEFPEGPGCAYLAGEMSASLGMRDFLLKERGWKRMNIRCKTFWAKGKAGLT